MRLKGFYKDAITELEKSYKIRERGLGLTHLDTMKANYSLGLAYSATKQYPDALSHLKLVRMTLELGCLTNKAPICSRFSARDLEL